MNPHASIKCAGRLLMALAAIASIVFAAGCGSSSSAPPPNNTGFSVANLKGTYVISIAGEDLDAIDDIVPFAIAGTITTDGNGNIAAGTVDINDPYNVGVHIGEPFPASTYTVGPDGRGHATLSTSVGPINLDFVLTSGNHGLITLYNTTGSGSGTIDLQVGATQTSLVSLAFSLSGADPDGNPLGTVGAFTLNSSGIIAAGGGVEDINDNGDSSASGTAGLQLTGGSLVLNPAGTSGTALLTSANAGFSSLGFDVWVIDSTHLKFIENDTAATGVLLAGDAFTQQTAFPASGQLVFTVGGADSSGDPLAAGGYVTTNASGTLSAGIEDFNDAGSVVPERGFSGSCATFTAGRCQLDMSGFTNLTFAAYPSSGGVLLLENDSNSLAIVQGAAYAQTATSFDAAQGYGLNLSGANTAGNGEVDDIAQFNTSGTSKCTNMTGIVDENDLGGTPQPFGEALCGTYTPDPIDGAEGRGLISVNTPGTYLGALNLEYYVIDSSTALFLDVDAFDLYNGQAAQLGAGVFGLQNASTDSAAPRHAIAIVHPAVRSRAAMRRK
jgi:hypothetical protein